MLLSSAYWNVLWSIHSKTTARQSMKEGVGGHTGVFDNAWSSFCSQINDPGKESVLKLQTITQAC